MAAEIQALATMDWWRIGTSDSPWWWGALSGKVVIAVYALLAAVLSACAVARFAGRTAGLWTAALALAMGCSRWAGHSPSSSPPATASNREGKRGV